MENLNEKDILNCILHIIRNGNLLNLSASIVMADFEQNKEKAIKEIEKEYKNFAQNLESEIKKGIEYYKTN